MNARLSRISQFLALRRSTVGMFAMVLLVGMGEEMAERFLPIYLLAVGGSAMSIGVLQAMDNFLSALYSFPGGYLADRIGTRKALLVFNLMAMAGFAVVILIPTWQAVLAGAVLFISWSAISAPATLSLIYKVLPPDKRTMGVSMVSIMRRIPKGLGPLMGGLCIALWGEREGVRLAFIAAFVLALFAVVLQRRLIADDGPRARAAAGLALPLVEKDPRRMFRLMSPEMRRLLFTDILVRFCEQIPYAFVVVWCMKSIPHPVTAVQFGVLSTIETVVALLCYIPVAHLADRGHKKRYVLITFGFFALFPLVLLYSRSFEWLVVAFAVRGLKEFGEPTRKSLIMDLAPDHNKAAMFGLYYLIRDVVVSAAALGGAYLWNVGPEVNLLAAFAFGVIGTITFALFGKDARSSAAPRP
ncbi:MAG TPA: MFS transporter [Candidatus Krumholzibacteria bacterium]|nr:MFS transporter [Candidatus Krumholzibacteria bacterium]